MEHSVPVVDAVRPWRTATLLASSLAAIELLILLAIAAVALGRPLTHHATFKRAATSSVPAHTRAIPPDKPRLARRDVEVEVLNGNGLQGAAAAEASRVRAKGYVIGNVGNAPSASYDRSIVMYRRGFRGEGLRLGRDLGIGAVGPLDGMAPSDLMGSHVVVVIGS